MKKTTPFTYFLCIITILFLLLSPAAIIKGISSYSHFSSIGKEKEPGYEGILSLWNVCPIKTGVSSSTAFLQSAVKRFEKRNPYVFIETHYLTEAQARALLESGEKPDIISFPLGFFADASLFCEINIEKDFHLSSCGKQGNELYALPFLYNKYILYQNKTLLEENELSPEDTAYYSYDELLATASNISLKNEKEQVFGIVFENEEFSLAPNAFLKYSPLEKEDFLQNINVSSSYNELLAAFENGYSHFKSGNAAFLVASSRFISLLENETLSFEYEAINSFSFTDSIQLISVINTEDMLKKEMCISFAKMLLEEKEQLNVCSYKSFPAVYYESAFSSLSEFDEIYSKDKSSILYPNSFEYAKNFQTIKKYALNENYFKNNSLSLIKDILFSD